MKNKTTKVGITSLAILALSMVGVSSASAQRSGNPLLRNAPRAAANNGFARTTSTQSSSSRLAVENGRVVQREVSGNAGTGSRANRARAARARRAAAARRRAARRR